MIHVLAWGMLPMVIIVTVLLELAYEKIRSKHKKSLDDSDFGLMEKGNDGCMVSLRMIIFGIVSIGMCLVVLRSLR